MKILQVLDLPYGNTGCGVFKWGVQKLERFLPKNQHTQRKFLKFENWVKWSSFIEAGLDGSGKNEKNPDFSYWASSTP